MKMPKKITTVMFAPCGINCMVCYKHCSKKTRQPCGGGISLHDKECTECGRMSNPTIDTVHGD